MIATLLVFSGRENPRWALSDETRRELLRRLSDLSPHTGIEGLPSLLGYAGIEVSATSGPGSFQRLRAFDGVVEIVKAGRLTTLRDDARRFEKWLLSTGAQTLPPEFFDRIQREVSSEAL